MPINNPIIVLTGKTASGKDTVMNCLLEKLPDLKRIVTTTSRPPRKNEKEGVDYYFISPEDFNNKIQEGEFLEYVKYGNNLYGTQKSQLLNSFNHGIIWRIDPSMAGKVKDYIRASYDKNTGESLLKRTIVIYLTVEDSVVLERLQERGLSQIEINQRMQDDKTFWEQYKEKYDFVVENMPGRLESTVDKVVQIIDNCSS